MKSFYLLLVLPVVAWAGEKSPGRELYASEERGALENPPTGPANQGISTSDLLTTRDINQEICFASSLSKTAREVRVATYKGRVTLRGLVENAAEKRQIQAIAESIAGRGKVLNEIEVRSIFARR